MSALSAAGLAASYADFRVSQNAVCLIARRRVIGDGRRRAGAVLRADTTGELAALMDADRAARPPSPHPAAPAGGLLTPAEAAAVLGTDVRAVGRLARARRLAFIRTPGGRRRYSAEQVRQLAATAGT